MAAKPYTSPPDREFMDRVQEAEHKFTDQARLSWLLNFTQRTDLLTLKDADLADAQSKIVAFAVSSDAVAVDIWWKKKTPPQLNALARELREGMERFLDGRGWRTSIKGQRILYKDQPNNPGVHDPDRPVWDRLETDLHSLIVRRAQNLLLRNYDRIQQCARPGCGRWFAKAKRQIFCSERCGTLVHSARWRAKAANREKMNEQRREAYHEARRQSDFAER